MLETPSGPSASQHASSTNVPKDEESQVQVGLDLGRDAQKRVKKAFLTCFRLDPISIR